MSQDKGVHSVHEVRPPQTGKVDLMLSTLKDLRSKRCDPDKAYKRLTDLALDLRTEIARCQVAINGYKDLIAQLTEDGEEKQDEGKGV